MAMVSSRLVFLVSICILVSQAIAQPDFLYHFCLDDKGNYTSNSTCTSHCSTIFLMAKALTKGDAKPDICRSCLNNATNLLPLLCPNQKEAIGWYDYCMLRHTIACYATQSVTYLASWEGSPAFFMWNVNNVSANYDQFSQDLRTLLDSKRVQAAAGGSLRKFAAGNATAPNNQTLYSLVQCTPDLSDQDCSDCLAGAMGDIPNCCDGKQGGRVIRPSCNLRFEVALFYDPTADNASSPSLSPPPPPVPSGKENIQSSCQENM
ncbi:cysteine-rich receptor-like protein kinase 25 [Quercus suber]|uniref:Cysteine-rich receptor-like protein kinase 25 n=1 Tax=Quercus suber TaxID=58331 RepID=A0AAW0IS66_QUESU